MAVSAMFFLLKKNMAETAMLLGKSRFVVHANLIDACRRGAVGRQHVESKFLGFDALEGVLPAALVVVVFLGDRFPLAAYERLQLVFLHALGVAEERLVGAFARVGVEREDDGVEVLRFG